MGANKVQLHMLPQFTIHHKLCTNPCSQKTLNYFFPTFTHTFMALGLFELHQNIHFCNILDKFFDQNNPIIFNLFVSRGRGSPKGLAPRRNVRENSPLMRFSMEQKIFSKFSAHSRFSMSLGSLVSSSGGLFVI